MPIPKIIHQIWIGPKPRPTKLMATFRDKHPDFEYILWTEEEMVRRGFHLENQAAYDSMEQWCGKADILRWEILYRYGGIYQDADAVCLEPFDKFLLSKSAFAAYENETTREGLVAVGTMGFKVGHPLCRAAIDHISTHPVSFAATQRQAWVTTGPILLTALLESGKYPDFYIVPSYYFIPQHFTGVKYAAHAKVYCHQVWGTTVVGYDTMNDTIVPSELLEPNIWVSLMISSYNTKLTYIRDCLESIRNQIGHFGIELIWIDDGSDFPYNKELELELERFRNMTRFTKVIYHRNPENLGVGASQKLGVELCTCELIVKMDSDDIMTPDRIQKQLDFMQANPDCMMAGAQLQYFRERGVDNPADLEFANAIIHPPIITGEFVAKTRSNWFMNHPTLIYRKSAILEIGNYNTDFQKCSEDYDMELRMLRRYGKLYNMPDIVLYYRMHEDQLTHDGKSATLELKLQRKRLRESLFIMDNVDNDMIDTNDITMNQANWYLSNTKPQTQVVATVSRSLNAVFDATMYALNHPFE